MYDTLSYKKSGDEITIPPDDGGEIVAHVDPSRGLAFVPDAGERQTIVGLPGAESLDQAAIGGDGSIAFAGDSETLSVNVMVAEEATRISVVIASDDQPEEFTYDFGAAAIVELQEDGSALVFEADRSDPESNAEVSVASIAAPWAIDADGNSLDTHYEAEGGTLVQVVEHRSGEVAYPVVADPTIDKPSIFQYRVRFNRSETASIAAGGWGDVVGSVSCGVMAPVCAIATGTLTYQSGVAQNSKPKRCVQVTATQPLVVPGLVWWVDTYRGGPCR